MRNFEGAGETQSGNGSARVFDLVTAHEARERQVEQALVVGIDEPPALFMRAPVFARNGERRTEAARLALDDAQYLRLLMGDNGRHAAFQDSRLLGGDFFHGD